METTVKLVLPLFGKTARAHDKAPLKVAACNQLLDEQSRHDRFARARIIGEQEPQRLTRKAGVALRKYLELPEEQ